MISFTEQSGFIGLFVSAFVSATVLPGGSEAMLAAMIHRFPETFWRAIGVATIGNTAGGMTSYLIGRWLPNRVEHKAIDHLRKYGYWVLGFSWLPIVGDAFCVAAGWLRFDAWRTLAWLALGKALRYLMVAGGWVWIEGLLNL